MVLTRHPSQCVNLNVKSEPAANTGNGDAFTTILSLIENTRQPSIIIKAGAAAGKTTFSKRFLLLCTTEMWARYVTTPVTQQATSRHPPLFYVPVLVFVVDLVAAIRKQHGGEKGNPLLSHFRSKLATSHRQHFKLVLQAWLDGRMILILDGWDELEKEFR